MPALLQMAQMQMAGTGSPDVASMEEMPATTTLVPPYVKKSYGIVVGAAVLYTGPFHDMIEGFKNVLGGESSYATKMQESVIVALERMYENAAKRGAQTVMGVRIFPYMLMSGSNPVFVAVAYGEAVDIGNYRRAGGTG